MLASTPFEDPCAAETEAALALGRLDGALRYLPPSASRILAARLLRESLIAALRQEGQAFSEHRFLGWFAGLTPLADALERPIAALRSPHATVGAILTALSHSSWPPLAALASSMSTAFLAVADTDVGSAHGDAYTLITEARELLATLEQAPSPLPFALLGQLHRATAGSMAFAPVERDHTQLALGDLLVNVERPAAPSPRWALEIHYGEYWRAAGLLCHALPLTGLIRLDALTDDESGQSRIVRAQALRDLASRLAQRIDEARALMDQLGLLTAQRRSTSRMPALFELLAGFGAMRSSQIEALLGATRLGVRKMIGSLEESGVLRRSTLAAVRLYEIVPAQMSKEATAEPRVVSAFSSAAIVEYDAAMDEVDRLLARLGTEAGDDDEV